MYYPVAPVARIDHQLSLIVSEVLVGYGGKQCRGICLQIFNTILEFSVSSVDWQRFAAYLGSNLAEVKKVST